MKLIDGRHETDFVYDPLGRRIKTSATPVVASVAQASQQIVSRSVFDPAAEFLEIGNKVDVNAVNWKVYGNDLNGFYGDLHGIGGLLSMYANDLATGGRAVIDDVFGHRMATVALTDNSLSWNAHHYTAYGQTGAAPLAIELGGDPLTAHTWRSYRTDPTGLICMGARYYDATGGRFLSPDPLGHGASMDLYSFADGDPVNFVDPTGRMGQDFGLLNDDPNFVRPEVDSFGDFFDIMLTDFPYAVYHGVFREMPHQAKFAGKELKSEAYAEITSSSDPLSGYLSGIKYYAGSAFQFGGMASGTVLGFPENAVDLTNHSLASVGFYGEAAQDLATDTTLLTAAEASFVAQNGLGFAWDNRGEIAHSFISGDPFGYSVGLTYQSDNTLGLGFVSGESQAASSIIDAVGLGAGHFSYRQFGGAIHGGNPGPLSSALALSGPFALANSWLGANRDLLSGLNSNGFDFDISYNNGFGFNLNYQNVPEISVDPVAGNNPTSCP